MQTELIEMKATKGQLWTGRILTGLTAAFLFLDAGMKLIKPEPVVTAFAQTGWPIDTCVPIGLTLLLCTVLYLVPRTAVIGALLLTAYLGGAVAANVRIHSPLFTNMLFPVYFGVMVWAGLLLRVPRLRRFLWSD